MRLIREEIFAAADVDGENSPFTREELHDQWLDAEERCDAILEAAKTGDSDIRETVEVDSGDLCMLLWATKVVLDLIAEDDEGDKLLELPAPTETRQ
jgi:hypothetical protein